MKENKDYKEFLASKEKKKRYEELKELKEKAWQVYKKIDDEMETIKPKVIRTRGDPSVTLE